MSIGGKKSAKKATHKFARSQKELRQSGTKPRGKKKIALPMRVKKATVKNKLSRKKKESLPSSSAVPSLEPVAKREGKILTQRLEREKRMIMWSGITFFMVLIVCFWIYNASQIFKSSEIKSDSEFTLDDWDKMSQEMGERLRQLKSGLEEIRDFGNSALLTPTTTQGSLPESGPSASSTSSSSSVIQIPLSAEEIQILKEKLESEQ